MMSAIRWPTSARIPMMLRAPIANGMSARSDASRSRLPTPGQEKMVLGDDAAADDEGEGEHK